MLYKYTNNTIEMLPSYDFKDLGGLEKDLENLLANNLSDLYSESGHLMPIFQERQWQSEPDLCAFDKEGNLYIFELKRGVVHEDTTIQLMRYSQEYGQKNYYELCSLYETYTGEEDLAQAHQDAFELEWPLSIEDFNRKQKLILVGTASDSSLTDAVAYWREKGVDIDFIPYRFYKLKGEIYFEFFAKPYDYHMNIAGSKGIIFDTNRTYFEDAIWDMFKHDKVSAYGDVRSCVNTFNKGDYVLYFHKGLGVVAAGIIKSGLPKEIDFTEEMYMKVDFLTPKATCMEDLECVSVAELRELLGKSFFWAKTTKVPYLSIEESKKVVDFLMKKYDASKTRK